MHNYQNKHHQKVVLIVDDRADNLQLLFKYLKEAEYKVLVAQSGKIAIKILESIIPDLILLDIQMPEMNGFEVCHCLKNNPITKDIPIVFMTGFSETIDKIQAFNLGAVDYITKPIYPEELLARVQIHLRLKELSENLLRQSQEQKVLLKISEQIRQSLNLDCILQTTVTEIQKLFSCDRVLIYRCYENAISFSAECTAEGITQLLPEYYLDFSLPLEEKTMLDKLGIKTQLLLPIIAHSTEVELFKDSSETIDSSSQFLGWLILHQCREERNWRLREIELLEGLSSQLAIAIFQRTLYQKLQNKNQELKQLAKKILYDN
jgi:CheY-like chemotaxis protein